MTESERLDLASRSDTPADEAGPPWTLLLVDDEAAVHQVSAMALKSFRWDGRPLRLLSALSAPEARELVGGQTDIAVALIDVVMESEHAGLELVRWLRENYSPALRVLIRSGQAGTAPPHEVAAEYDIDGYLDKAVLTADDLRAHLIIQLRAYRRRIRETG